MYTNIKIICLFFLICGHLNDINKYIFSFSKLTYAPTVKFCLWHHWILIHTQCMTNVFLFFTIILLKTEDQFSNNKQATISQRTSILKIFKECLMGYKHQISGINRLKNLFFKMYQNFRFIVAQNVVDIIKVHWESSMVHSEWCFPFSFSRSTDQQSTNPSWLYIAMTISSL